VGVGQTELGIMDLADTTVVVTVPEGGDAVQVMKAGLNEIADVFVVNKADRDGADRIKAELELNVHLRPAGGWSPPVLMTQAAADKGVDQLVESIAKHRDYLAANHDPARDAERRTNELIEVLSGELGDRAVRALKECREDGLLSSVRSGQLNPYGAVRKIIEDPAKLLDLLAIGKNGTAR
jgi:LAO/AO transport system kinase